jgi:16S rRNA (adenine1518-N6/adenine1519-N6)-dimethyltransferase
MSSLEETKYILKKYNIKANKRLGQNFLINDNAIQEIVNAAGISAEDLIIEIGPGLGTLTSKLLEKAGKVIAVELDENMIKILEDRFKLYENFILINEDILKIDLKKLIEENLNDLKNVKIVANLPYYITTPIIMKLLEDRLNINSITVMVQKEVADRIAEKPGEKLSGAITYSVNYYAIPEKVTLVGKESFIPSPEVDSEVIKLNIRKEPPVKVDNEEMFFKLIKVSFMQRRKTLLNALTNSGLITNKEKLKQVLEKINLDLNIRGEKLTLEQYAKLANLINQGI